MKHAKSTTVAVVIIFILYIIAIIISRKMYLSNVPPQLAAIPLAVPTATLTIWLSLQALIHAKSISEEPWIITYRKLHEDFWNNIELGEVRRWICSEDAYNSELKPVLLARLNNNHTSPDYHVLEKLDKFCSIMLRVAHINESAKSKQQRLSFDRLGYTYWFDQLYKFPEVMLYIDLCWKHLGIDIRKTINEFEKP